MTTCIRGSSWGHARGHDPLVASARRYADDYPVEIEWTARTLTEFGVLDVGDLAEEYDLVVIDHPHVGSIAEEASLVPLDEVLGSARLESLGYRSPGSSHQSYAYSGHQWALAIDAACQVAAWRSSFPAADAPRSWAELVDLASTGRVIWPVNPIDAQASFLTIAAAMGTPIDAGVEPFIPERVGVAVLEAMHAVTRHLDPLCFELNAIGALEALASGTGPAEFCPLVFGYTNYSRAGFRPTLLRFGDIVSFHGDGQPRGALLGGVGLGVSSRSDHVREAAEFVLWVAGADVQRTIFLEAGGQPAHVAAWDDPVADRLTGGFFSGTRKTIDASWTRPRLPGYVRWQNSSLPVIHETLLRGGGFEATVSELNRIAADAFHHDESH